VFRVVFYARLGVIGETSFLVEILEVTVTASTGLLRVYKRLVVVPVGSTYRRVGVTEDLLTARFNFGV